MSNSFDNLQSSIFRKSPELKKIWDDSQDRRVLALTLIYRRRRANLTVDKLAQMTGWEADFIEEMEDCLGKTPEFDAIRRYLDICETEARTEQDRPPGP